MCRPPCWKEKINIKILLPSIKTLPTFWNYQNHHQNFSLAFLLCHWSILSTFHWMLEKKSAKMNTSWHATTIYRITIGCFYSTFYSNTQLSECRNKLFEESFRKILKMSKYLHRSKQNFVFDFLNRKSTNKFKNFQHTLISRSSPLNFYFFPGCLFCKYTACIQCTLWSLIICRISYLFLNFTFYKSRVEDAGCSSTLRYASEVYLWSDYWKFKL
jgi:hypothetical protein